MNLNNLKLGTRLTCGFVAVLALMLMIAGFSFQRLVKTQTSVNAAQAMDDRVTLATEWVGDSRLNVARLLAIVKSGGNADVNAHFAPLMKDTTEKIGTMQKKLEADVSDDKGRALMADVGDKRKVFIAAREEVLAALKAEAKNVPELLNKKLTPASETYLASIGAFKAYQDELSSAEGAKVTQEVSFAKVALLVLAAIGLAVGLVTAWIMTRSVTRPLQRAVEATRTIAGGDLSQNIEVEGKDELGNLLRGLSDMQNALRSLVGQVRSSTDSISTASSEIATGNHDLSIRTEQTASNLQQAASSMEQLTGTVKQSADSARQANQLATSAAEVAARGGQVVSQVVATMDDINASSKKISDIIGVIDGIAFQTNILALNAAVEAARAGEQGRGFAVVAGEVRSLAQRSAEAAKEIKSLIGASVDKVQGGSRLVADAGQTMNEIVSSVQRVSDIIGEITAASAEQSDGIGQINSSVTQLDQMTQQNAALVEESAAAAQSLKEQAGRLSDVVATFRLGASTYTPSAVAPAAPARAATPAPKPVTAAAKPKAAPAPVVARKPAAPTPAPAHAAAGADDWETF